MFPLVKLLIFPLKVLVHPNFWPSEGHIFSGFELKFDKSFGEKLSVQNDFSFELIPFSMSLNEDIFDLCELIIDQFWEVESRSETNVVGVYFSEGFDLSYSIDGLDSWGNDVLLFVRSRLSLRFLSGDRNDQILTRLDLFKVLFWINQFKRLRPVKLFISLRPHFTWLYLKYYKEAKMCQILISNKEKYLRK